MLTLQLLGKKKLRNGAEKKRQISRKDKPKME
jgi:hypothetical protein